jgi:hypothetical protein
VVTIEYSKLSGSSVNEREQKKLKLRLLRLNDRLIPFVDDYLVALSLYRACQVLAVLMYQHL